MNTIRTYKLLRQDTDRCLHPLFIDRAMVMSIGEWLIARAPDTSKAGDDEGYYLMSIRPSSIVFYRQQKPRMPQIVSATIAGQRWIEVRQGKRGKRIYDLGLDSNGSVTRFAHRPGWHSSAESCLPGVNMDGKVWAECLIPADDYYIRRMSINGMTAKSQPVEWYISQKIMITKVLNEGI